MNRPEPRPGERYRHFKERQYQIITVASHSETGEKLVVYQALYGDFDCYARPLTMFLSEVDHEKYPHVAQKWRFEKIESSVEAEQEKIEKEESQDLPNPDLLRFLESKSWEEKLEILEEIKGKLGEVELENIFLSLDIPLEQGDQGVRIAALRKYLETQQRYDGSRLR